ncbi:ASCH domain-containing protein [Candidatus Pacearchaeota archaeon]|nr:ASCH domain-containing protein [Candidatus Pacearchaeota archaeon]
MSFAITKEQIENQTKTVTRRLGWKFLKPGDIVQPVEKCMGLKKGEKIKRIGGPIRIVDISKELLYEVSFTEMPKEGFPGLTSFDFVNMFCKHMKCKSDQEVTRIEFEYTEILL